MRKNPYLIEGPAIISFSGGRSSGYMLKHIIDAHGGKLPDDVVPVFANTGKEMPETLDFVQRCSEEWSTPIVWVEYDWDSEHRTRIVNHNSASRNGEPFERLLKRKGFLPNPTIRFCTHNLKIERIQAYARHWLGWKRWDDVIGIRADERSRAHKIKTCDARAGRRKLGPMIDAKVSAADVGAWWRDQPFDLTLPNINGKTPLGNCDLCFLKSATTIFGIMRDRPELADWWIEQEARGVTLDNPKNDGRFDPNNAAMAIFRSDRPRYAEILRFAQSQGDLFNAPQGWDWSADDCACTD